MKRDFCRYSITSNDEKHRLSGSLVESGVWKGDSSESTEIPKNLMDGMFSARPKMNQWEGHPTVSYLRCIFSVPQPNPKGTVKEVYLEVL
jgi:hypothetical protein